MVIDQGKVGAIISEIFDINHDYVGSLFSNIAKVCPIRLKMNAIPWNIKMKSQRIVFPTNSTVFYLNASMHALVFFLFRNAYEKEANKTGMKNTHLFRHFSVHQI